MELVSFAAGCVLSIAEVSLEPTETGWKEEAHVEVLAEGRCREVDVLLPAGVELTRMKARVRLSDGTKHKLDALRQRRVTRDLDGAGAIRLYAPELIPGDRVEIDLERTRPARPIEWEAGPGVRYASLESSVPFDVPDGVRVDAPGLVWVSEPSEAVTITLPHPESAPEPQVLTPVEGAKARVVLDLLVDGDPMRKLYPGGGSRLKTTWSVELPEGDADRGLVVPLPVEASEVAIDGPHIRRDDSVVLWAAGGASATHSLSWTEPDAPVYGERITLEGAEVEQEVVIEGGRIRWQDDQTWWLVSIGVMSVVPERSLLIRALDKRFRRAALPEPALPNQLRGLAPAWDVVAQIRPLLAKRAGVADLPIAPLFPRRLIKARNTGAITSVEAALIVWLEASQARVPASWAIVRPASRGPGWHTSPAGFTEGVVAISFQDETRWIDPGCRVCGPFELRPELEGADMLSPIGLRTPPPRQGSVEVVDSEEGRVVRLDGPPALELRLALSELAPSARQAALVTRWGGEDATLVGSTGIADLGAPIEMTFEGTRFDPPFRAPEGSWWVWEGSRTWKRPVDREDGPQHAHQGDLCWTALTEEGRRIENLEVRSRRIPQDVAASIFSEMVVPPPAAPPDADPIVTDPSSQDGGPP